MAGQQRVVILQMGHPPASVRDSVGEQADWFQAVLADGDNSITTIQAFLGESLPSPEHFDVAIITGSWSMVTDREPWSEAVAAWIPGVIASGRRLLGVCYGHQLMADALGGVVDYNPRGREVGLAPISLTEAAHQDPFFADAPAAFMANVSHEQTVVVAPTQASVLDNKRPPAIGRDPFHDRLLFACLHPGECSPKFQKSAKIQRMQRLQ